MHRQYVLQFTLLLINSFLMYFNVVNIFECGLLAVFTYSVHSYSYTFDRVQRQTDLHWNFQRYALIKKYHDRPPLPPPLILFNHLFLVCCCLTGFCRKTPVDNDDRFRKSMIALIVVLIIPRAKPKGSICFLYK